MQGRSPVPTAILEARGSWRAKARNGEVSVKCEMPDKPTMSDAAGIEWDRLTAILFGLGIVTPIDADALRIYCETFVTWQEAQAKVRKQGPIVKAPSGYPIQNPYLSIANSTGAFCKSLLEQFGMTPSSRTRVHKVETKKQTTFPRLEIAK